MRKPRAALRLGVMLLFMLGLLSPVAATGVGAQDLSCDDFNTQSAAQAVLDADPSLEDALDPDGDGIACNEDEGTDNGEATEEAEETPDGEETEEAEETPDDNGGSQDGEAYLADIQDEVDTLTEQVERFLEIDQIGADATQDEIDELNQIAEDWSNYPDDVAAEFEAPAGYEDVEDAYLELADLFGESGDLWADFWATEPDSAEEDEALDAFNEVFIQAQDQIVVVQEAIDEAGGGGTNGTEEATEEATEEGTEEATDDEYLETIQDEVDTVVESFDRFEEINDTFSDADEDEQADMVAELEEIAQLWADYPSVAADIEAPAEFEEVGDAYADFADAVGEAGDTWLTWWDIPSGDPEEDAAFDDFETAFDDAQAAADDVYAAIDDAGGSSNNNGEEPTEEATEEATEESNGNGGDVDAEDYLATVGDTAADWNDSVDRFNEIIASETDLTDADFEEIAGIVGGWLEAPAIAAEVEAPAGLEDVQDAYEAYADELSNAAIAFTTWASAEADSPDADAAFEDFVTAIGNAETLYADLEDAIAAAE